jgi:hypothetical protein
MGSLALFIMIYVMNNYHECLLHDGITWIIHNGLCNGQVLKIFFYMKGSRESDIILYVWCTTFINVFYTMSSLELHMIDVYLMDNFFFINVF